MSADTDASQIWEVPYLLGVSFDPRDLERASLIFKRAQSQPLPSFPTVPASANTCFSGATNATQGEDFTMRHTGCQEQKPERGAYLYDMSPQT
ncbi:hypothetical protein IFR04_012327 [Cadophora malorum]|uniref:Uncharacterized protein n=1 Tax=Cadophora malorum TaxID=108018 RepID=A0A8H7T7T0_9HELO|nr:hypothetical protein IFR04_012327 [Cadophora malorum]